MANNRPGQRAVLPALPENALSKKSVNPETDGLELCKQAVALLVGDLRAEVQQAVGQLKGEANAAKNPLGSKLLNVADGLQQAEKDQNRLDQQMQVNALLGDHLGASRDLTVGTVANLEQCMKRLEANVSREYGEMRSELSRVKEIASCDEIVTNISSQVERETLAIQEQNTQQAANVEGRLLEELGLVRSEPPGLRNQVSSALRQLENQTIQCNEGIGTIITAEHQLKAIADGITAEVLRLQQQDDKHYVDLGQNLDVKIANQDEHLLTILQQNDSFITLPQDVSRLRRKVNEDIRLVLGEITRVQKALQVDYLPPSKLRSNSRKLSDGHRRSREEMATVKGNARS
eukprot:g2665.t1